MAIDFKRNINQVYKDQEPFWGKYIELNNASVPSLSAIQEYQLQKIESFQKMASQQVEKKNAAINALFTSGNINILPNQFNKDEDYELGKALTSIVGMLNGTYKANSSKDNNIQYNYELLQKTLKSLESVLAQLNQVIISNNGTGIPAHYITTLQSTIAACNITSLDTTVLNNWFKHLNKFKGDLVEDIGVAWLSTMKVPTTTINTGAVNYQGSTVHGRKGQLIQDLMTLQIDGIELDTIPIEYRTINGTMVKTSIRDFISAMEQASNEHKQIVIEDSGYETLLQLSALNIQAKAGINQKPWNETKSTMVSIGEYTDETGGLMLSVKRTFQLLHELDQDNTPQKDIWVANQSKDYNYLADYGLATVMFKVLHLDTEGNNYLLTPLGFTTFTERIKYLMEKRRSRVYIKDNVTINNDTLGTAHNVGMTYYN